MAEEISAGGRGIHPREETSKGKAADYPKVSFDKSKLYSGCLICCNNCRTVFNGQSGHDQATLPSNGCSKSSMAQMTATKDKGPIGDTKIIIGKR